MIKFIRGFFSFIFSFIFAIFLFGFILLNTLRWTFNKENVSSIIKDVLNKENVVSQVEDNSRYKIQPLANNKFELDDNSKVDGEALKDLPLLNDFIENWTLPEETTEYILKDEAFEGIVSDFIVSYINYTVYGGDKPTLPTEEINQMIERGVKAYEKDKNVVVEGEIPKVTNEMSEEISNVIDKEYSTNINGKYNVAEIVKFVFSNELYYGALACVIGSFLMIVLINFSVASGFGWCFLPTGIIGGIFLLIGKLKNLVTDNISDQETLVKIFNIFVKRFDKVGSYTVATAIVMLFLWIVLKILFPKKKKKLNNSEEPNFDTPSSNNTEPVINQTVENEIPVEQVTTTEPVTNQDNKVE